MNNPSRKHLVVSQIFTVLMLLSGTESQGQLSSLPSQPWPSNPVTISFAPDFVEIGRYRNELHQHMNNRLGYPNWKIEMLRAFQTWARFSDITFAVAPDYPRAFGVPGLAQGDPRFGDIRLGAFPQSYVLGNAVPYHPSAGVWAGDIFLDTNRKFIIDHGLSGNPSPDEYDLYSVLLHEAGNSLGLLDDEEDPESVMFFAYIGTRLDLSPKDIRNIQALYGPPSPDPWELVSTNEDFATASSIQFGSEFPKTLVEVREGRIQDESDVDCYRFEGNSLAENCWVKLRARGRSLLCGRITVYDESFKEIATISAGDPLNNSVGKEITGISPGEVIYVVIDSSGVPDFEFGDYQLALDFNLKAGEEFEQPDDDENPPGFFEADDDALVDTLYTLEGPIDTETNANNTFAKAVELFAPIGVPSGSRFEIVSALATPTDKDVFKIRTAADATGTVAIELTPLGIDPALVNVLVYNSARQVVPVTRRILVTGDVVVEVNKILPSSIYYLCVQSRAGNTLAGNYLLMVNVATKSTNLQRIAEVALSTTSPDQFGEFTTYKTQLFRFDLSMTSLDSSNQACQFTIYSDSGRVELVTSVLSAGRQTAYVWLQAGQHHFRFTSRTRNNRRVAASIVKLVGASISDDEGPILLDPSGNPVSGPQIRGTNPTPPPIWLYPRFIIGLVIPPELPSWRLSRPPS